MHLQLTASTGAVLVNYKIFTSCFASATYNFCQSCIYPFLDREGFPFPNSRAHLPLHQTIYQKLGNPSILEYRNSFLLLWKKYSTTERKLSWFGKMETLGPVVPITLHTLFVFIQETNLYKYKFSIFSNFFFRTIPINPTFISFAWQR